MYLIFGVTVFPWGFVAVLLLEHCFSSISFVFHHFARRSGDHLHQVNCARGSDGEAFLRETARLCSSGGIVGMGCGASNPSAAAHHGADFVHLKHLDKNVKLPGAKNARLPRTVTERPVQQSSRREGDDETEDATRSMGASQMTRDMANLVGATQQLVAFITSEPRIPGQGPGEDRLLSSIGDHDALSRAALSINAGINQAGALRVLLRAPDHDPNVRDADGDRVPLHWAAARGHTKCALALLRGGAGKSRAFTRTATPVSLTGRVPAAQILS